MSMTSNYSELMRELINRELLFFKSYHVDIKEAKCAFQWWEKHESLFTTIEFLG